MTPAVGDAAVSPDDAIEPLLYTPAQAVKRIGVELVSERWLRRMAGERRIPCTRIGRSIGFSEEDIQAIIAQFNSPVAKRRARRR
jgi:helix-turn-helix protein